MPIFYLYPSLPQPPPPFAPPFQPFSEYIMADYDPNSQYHYDPTEWIAIMFVVLFSITTILHLGELIYWRMWWLLPTVIVCGILEIVGWSGRLWSSLNVSADTPFLMQITTTIIAPTPLVAANFILLGRIIRRLGSRYSRLGPKLYTTIFLTCDIIALVVQGGGGGIASGDDNKNAVLGGNIMLGGIIFQLIAIICYVSLAAEFLTRYIMDKPFQNRTGGSQRRGRTDKHMKILLTGMSFMTLFILIRSIYRTIELADGWNGKIISTQVLFNVLDGGMITLAMFTFNICHPGYLLRPESESVDAITQDSTIDIPLDPKYSKEGMGNAYVNAVQDVFSLPAPGV